MTAFFRFPHTPHLAWLGEGEPRDDKVLSPPEADELLDGEVVVEEKIDGANLGFSTTEDGELQCQNRGSYLQLDACHPQFRPLRAWLGPCRTPLVDALWPDLMLFGEWCHAVHSVRYDRLPDWFLGFDVYDRAQDVFWDTARRDRLLAQLGLRAVPHVDRGRHTVASLQALFGTSQVGSEPLEGLVLRRAAGGLTVARSKLVRPAFTQAIETHWSRGPLVLNRLAAGDRRWP
ncbi:MAG: RNA ligase family protein [Myxococcota bacterium]|jgi:hypothetical protein|nr:RNA ligase family protein [Myxococcota bacterium]